MSSIEIIDAHKSFINKTYLYSGAMKESTFFLSTSTFNFQFQRKEETASKSVVYLFPALQDSHVAVL